LLQALYLQKKSRLHRSAIIKGLYKAGGAFMRIAVVATAVSFSILGLATADDASAAIRKPTHIAAQPLGRALKELAQSRGLQVLYFSETVRDLRTQGAAGSLTTDEAFGQLLSGTGLTYRYLDDKTVTIVPTSTGSGSISSQEQPAASRDSSKDNQSQDGVQKKSFWDRFLVAQVDQGQTSSPSTVEKQDEQASRKKPIELEEVIVTGSRLKQASAEGAQDVKVYSRENIEQSGQTTVADFLNTLPDVSQATTESPFQAALGTTTVQLHGLPYGTTLVLLNGRRVETSGTSAGQGDYFDLNSIPLAAVERIELVSQGASAIYGSDAIGGVVNVILKKDFQGFEASAKYGGAKGVHETDAGVAFGRRWDKGSVSIIASYMNRGELEGSERSITRNADYRPLGGVDARVDFCNPGNVFFPNGYSFNGQPAVQYAAVPAGFSGHPSVQEFAPTAGTLNKCTFNVTDSFIPPTHREGVLAQGDFELTPSIQLFAEAMLSDVYTTSFANPPLFYGQPGFQSFNVPASNPYNPFGQTVGIGGLVPSLGRGSASIDSVFFRPLVGAHIRLLDNWELEMAGWSSQDRTKTIAGIDTFNSTAVQRALNSTDPSTALNPFIAGPPGSPQLLQSLILLPTTQYFVGKSLVANGFVRGPVARLPSGQIEAVFGSEYGRDQIYTSDNVNVTSGKTPHRTQYAIFGEIRIPILGRHGDTQSGDTLAATIAGRYDNYDDFGGKTTPQLGAEWRPFDTLLIRSTYGRAFRAPPLADLYGATFGPFQNIVVDPRRANERELVNATFGANPHLGPETGQSQTFGLVYSNKAIPNLRISITHWRIQESNNIQLLPAQILVDNEDQFQSYVIRASSCLGSPPCPIVQVNAIDVNFGKINLVGLDYFVSYKLGTDFGELAPTVSATDTYHFTSALTPGGRVIDGTSRAIDFGSWAPRWKGTAALGWKRGPYGANIDARYVGHYQDYDSTRMIGNFWLCDLNVRYGVGQAFASKETWLKGAYLELGGVNIFNSLPQYSNFFFGSVGYDPTQSDLRGRLLYAQFGTKW
jgi:iron complex outermembrane recepter protein